MRYFLEGVRQQADEAIDLSYTRRVQEQLGVSAPTARNTIKALEEHGMLREVTGRNWGRVYRADEIYILIRGDQ